VNYSEAIALLTAEILELARDGKKRAEDHELGAKHHLSHTLFPSQPVPESPLSQRDRSGYSTSVPAPPTPGYIRRDEINSRSCSRGVRCHSCSLIDFPRSDHVLTGQKTPGNPPSLGKPSREISRAQEANPRSITPPAEKRAAPHQSCPLW